MKYKNTTGWTVNMFGIYGQRISIPPYEEKDIKFKIKMIPEGVIREQKIIRKIKEPIQKENKESDI